VVEVKPQGGGRFTARINDVSTSGVFIESAASFPVSTNMQLKFRIANTQVETLGEVRYCMSQVGMGVRFLELLPEYRAVIEGFVEGHTPVSETAFDVQIAPSPTSVPLTPIVLSGSFAAINLYDVIHMIDTSRLTGTLKVGVPGVHGDIYFNNGQIVGAQSAAIYGLEAMRKFLGANQGMFSFKQSSEPYERTIYSTNNTGLLLDLLTAMDEDSVNAVIEV
jgi:hypothetical protein